MPFAPGRVPSPRGALARARSPRDGWTCERAPGRRLWGLDLGAIDEDAVARGAGGLSIVALGADPTDYDPTREPLVLVHGLYGAPKDFQCVVDRLAPSGFQLYAAAYEDAARRTSKNGDALADALVGLAAHLVDARPVTIVAHSMGALVARRALNRLALRGGRPLERFAGVDLMAIDAPWQGYEGPGDHGLGALAMFFARPVMDDGLEDMRAASDMFQGDPASSDEAARQGLYRVSLPAAVRVELAFASRGILTRPEAAGVRSALSKMLLGAVRDDAPPRGDPRVVNLWLAVVSSTAFPLIEDEAEKALRAGRLDEREAARILDRHLPTFEGDHAGVLKPQPGASLVDWLARRAGV